MDKFHKNKTNNTFIRGTLSFQASSVTIQSSKGTSVSIDTIKWFLGKIGERYRFKKNPESHHENTTSSESSVNKVMEAMMAGDNDPSTQDPVWNVTDEDGLLELFDQFSGLMLLMSDCLEPDTIVITEATLQGKCATYMVTIQNIVTTALLDTGANILVVLEKFFRSLSQTFQLFKEHMHKVTSASGATLGPIGLCDLTFMLGEK